MDVKGAFEIVGSERRARESVAKQAPRGALLYELTSRNALARVVREPGLGIQNLLFPIRPVAETVTVPGTRWRSDGSGTVTCRDCDG